MNKTIAKSDEKAERIILNAVRKRAYGQPEKRL